MVGKEIACAQDRSLHQVLIQQQGWNSSGRDGDDNNTLSSVTFIFVILTLPQTYELGNEPCQTSKATSEKGVERLTS